MGFWGGGGNLLNLEEVVALCSSFENEIGLLKKG